MLNDGNPHRWKKDRKRARCNFRMPALAAVGVFLGVFLLVPSRSMSQLAQGKGRFIGNALSSGIPIYSNFSKYWNQVTPGNAGKWGSVEGVMNSYDWTWLDAFYNYAMNKGFLFKDHCLIWGAQQPGWIPGALDSAQQRAKVEQWIDTVCSRYESMAMVDVVNEPFHQPPPYMHALGDSGKTGWDWVVTAFTWARQYTLRGVKLLLNEYNILQDNAVTTRYLALIDTLRVRGLIDGIGVQGHYFEFKGSGYTYDVNTLKANLDRLVATGLPVYSSEFDINEANDSTQLANYKIYFPLFWENPGVKGITLWGYVQGDMWKTDAYLIRYDGSERPALQWLRNYIASPLPPILVSPVSTTGEPMNPRLVWRSSASALSYRVQVSTLPSFSPIVVDTTLTDTTAQLAPLSAFTVYNWRVAASNDSGPSSYSSAAWFRTGDQIVAVEESRNVPAEFALGQNYPNPFNPTTVIEYAVGGISGQQSVVSNVRLTIHDLLGREVATLVNEKKPAGNYAVRFDASGLACGVYLCRLTAGLYVETRRMVLIK
jgi:endo-1,4-beta-xylanase